MLVIGDKINILNPAVYKAISASNMSEIINLALLQSKAGVDMISINLGADLNPHMMEEVVRSIRDVVDLPICLSGSIEMIEAGLKEMS